MKLRSEFLVAVGLLAVSSAPLALPPPQPPPVPVTWSLLDTYQMTESSWNWHQSRQLAAEHVEEGFTDWRLPTRAEYQAAIQNGSYGQSTASASWSFWTSDSRGGQQAWVVRIVTDSNGIPIPSQSGQTTTINKQLSYIDAKFVRP